MNDRMRLMVLVGVPVLAVTLYALLTVLFGADQMLWVAGMFLASLDRVLGILVILPRWASWAVILFILGAGTRLLLWENQKVSEGQRMVVVVAALVLLLLAAAIPPLLGAGRGQEKGVWWRPDSYRKAGTERMFDEISFVWAPAGHYLMGSPVTEPGRDVDEGRRDVVFSRGFWISRKEITVDQYNRVMGNLPKETPEALDNPEFPVTGVSHGEAVAFAQKLTESGKAVYRLPSESEWEYACLAGTTTPWSSGADPTQLPEYAWFSENSDKAAHAVGKLKPNPWGIYDMHGNAAEWCLPSRESGKTAAEPLYRGGNWREDAAHCRSAARGILFADETQKRQMVGIRLVRDP